MQVGYEAAKGLGTLRKPTLLNGSLRLRDGVSYLDQDSLADWLHRVLEQQIRELCGEGGGESVTFEELYRLTDIELDVVAVDLNRQRLVIFNYELTPHARSARRLWRPPPSRWHSSGGRCGSHRPPFGIIVDGGVMANFPTFVFKDPSFRNGRVFRASASVPVLGFLLEEQDRAEPTQPDLYRESSFLPPMSQWESIVEAIGPSGELPDDFEPKRRKFRPRREEPSTGANLARALGRPLRVALWPVWKLLFDWIPRGLRRNAGSGSGNWPPPRNPVIRWLVHWFDPILAGTRPFGGVS